MCWFGERREAQVLRRAFSRARMAAESCGERIWDWLEAVDERAAGRSSERTSCGRQSLRAMRLAMDEAREVVEEVEVILVDCGWRL